MAEAICQICGNTLTYTPETVGLLARHFCVDHPNHEIGHFAIPEGQSGCNMSSTTTSGNVKIRKTGTCVPPIKGIEPCDPCNCEVDCEKQFKTTVESWSQSPNEMKCPQCGVRATPLIRRQRNKIAKSSLGAMCLLGCWPLCFLPFLLGGSNILNLYCKACGAFIATYDRHLGRIEDGDGTEKIEIPNLCSE